MVPMALNTFRPSVAQAAPNFAAPTVSETIPRVGDDVFLYVKVGATATTVTLVTPGTLETGDAVPDKAYGPLTNTELFVAVPKVYADAEGKAAVTFSQVTNVTACIIRAD